MHSAILDIHISALDIRDVTKGKLFCICNAASALRIYFHMALLMRGGDHEGRGFEQRAEQETFEKIAYYMPIILTPPPTVKVIF